MVFLNYGKFIELHDNDASFSALIDCFMDGDRIGKSGLSVIASYRVNCVDF